MYNIKCIPNMIITAREKVGYNYLTSNFLIPSLLILLDDVLFFLL